MQTVAQSETSNECGHRSANLCGRTRIRAPVRAISSYDALAHSNKVGPNHFYATAPPHRLQEPTLPFPSWPPTSPVGQLTLASDSQHQRRDLGTPRKAVMTTPCTICDPYPCTCIQQGRQSPTQRLEALANPAWKRNSVRANVLAAMTYLRHWLQTEHTPSLESAASRLMVAAHQLQEQRR